MSLLQNFDQIRFKWLGPDSPVPESWQPAMELENTWLGPNDAELKARLQPLLDMQRMSTLAIAALINQQVSLLPPGQAYVNVGVWHGFSFLAALPGNATRHCIGIDNFSQHFEALSARASFLERFAPYRSASHQFFEMDYREFFAQPAQVPPIGLYFYDGSHSYAQQLEALTLADPFLAPGALLLIDDINWLEALSATEDFMLSRPDRYQILRKIHTHQNGHPTFWNGLLLAQKLN